MKTKSAKAVESLFFFLSFKQNLLIQVCDFMTFLMFRVCFCHQLLWNWVPGRKHHQVCGISLRWHNCWYEVTSGISHEEGMHWGCFQDMAVVHIRSGRAMNAGLGKLTWISFDEQCEQHSFYQLLAGPGLEAP